MLQVENGRKPCKNASKPLETSPPPLEVPKLCRNSNSTLAETMRIVAGRGMAALDGKLTSDRLCLGYVTVFFTEARLPFATGPTRAKRTMIVGTCRCREAKRVLSGYLDVHKLDFSFLTHII